MKVRYWLLIFLLAGGAGLYWLFAIPATVSPAGEESQARYQPGHYSVTSEDFHAVDESRDTPPNRDLPGIPGRDLKGKLWRPEGLQEPGPLLVHSHGFTSTHLEALYLANFLASHGYTVVAVDYPLTNYNTEGQPLVTDVINQPGDVRFIIDTLLARNATEGDTLFGTIDPQRIAASGISLGGLTTTLATFDHRYRDPRIRAAISVAGPSNMLLPQFFLGTDTPYLAIYGNSDVVVPYATNAKPLLKKRPGTILVTLDGGSHGGFIQLGATAMRFLDNPDELGCKFVIAGLEDELAEDNALYTGVLGDTPDGIDTGATMEVCADQPPAKTMQSARQHMFTILAAHSFLQSVFSSDPSTREEAGNYLLHDLAAENPREVSVSMGAGAAPATASLGRP